MIKKLCLGSIVIGLLILIGSRICQQFITVSDFTRGFIDGISGTFIIIGLICIALSILIKKNPSTDK